MKRLLCGLAAVGLTTGTYAAESGNYFKLDVGPNYVGETTQEFLNPPFTRDLDWNIGVRASVAEGFALNRFLALEVESGLIWNELDESVDWIMQVPLLANIVLRYECKGGFTTFVGAGGGGAVFMANTTVIDDDSDATLVPAWQAMAGLNYNVGSNLSIGLVYKYLGMANPELELTLFGQITQKFKFHDIHNHYGGLQLTYNF